MGRAVIEKELWVMVGNGGMFGDVDGNITSDGY